MVYRQQSGLSLRRVGESTLLIPLGGDADSIYTLNKTGAFLWYLIYKPKSEADLVVALQQAYGIDEVTASRDVGVFLVEMSAMGLLGAGE